MTKHLIMTHVPVRARGRYQSEVVGLTERERPRSMSISSASTIRNGTRLAIITWGGDPPTTADPRRAGALMACGSGRLGLPTALVPR